VLGCQSALAHTSPLKMQTNTSAASEHTARVLAGENQQLRAALALMEKDLLFLEAAAEEQQCQAAADVQVCVCVRVRECSLK
jgi:DUF438 domain-containing protein